MSAYLAEARLAITGERHRPSALEALNRAATPNLSNNITISNYQRSINIANCISGIRILSKLASELTREDTLHMKPFQVLQLCWIAFQLHANVKELLSEEPIPGKSASHILKKHLEKNVSSSFVSGRTVVSIFQWIFTLFFGRSYLRYNSMYIVTVERSEILSDFIDGGHGSMNWKRRMVKDQWSTSYSERSCTRNIYNNK